MNVTKEFRDANRRIKGQIDENARAALIRIGVDPGEVAREEAEQRVREARERFAAFGTAVGTAFNTMLELAASFAQGIETAMATELEQLDRPDHGETP